MSNITRYTQPTRPSLLGNSVFDSFFNDFFADDVFPTHLTKTTSGYPVADIYQGEDGSTIIEFALAGFSRSELMVDVKPDRRSITISAESSDVEIMNPRRIARRAFTKTYVNYDDNLDLSLAEARFENGLLTVTVPQRPETQAVTIEIQ
jgi:HSP20 family molecular chaperone IbpA